MYAGTVGWALASGGGRGMGAAAAAATGTGTGTTMHHVVLLAIVVVDGVLLLLGSGASSVVAQQSPVFACDASRNGNVSAYGFCDGSLALESRVRDLVERLTLGEKIGFLVNKGTGVGRLGIPAYEWWSEALHGVSYVGPGTHFSSLVPGATSFPQVILTAASFNASLFEAIGKAVSTEARAMYNVGLAGLTYWSPNVNVFRDPRWGRGQETPGEDPLLVGKYATGYVRGLQGADDDPKRRLKVAACCKHYTAYDLDNWNGTQRYTFNAKVSKQDLHDTFQPPFERCVKDGHVASVMCSYNQVNGVPTCADPHLLARTVRGKWKLNGYIVSDCDSVDVLYNAQHYTKSPEEAAAKSIRAGLDLNCGSFLGRHTAAAVAAGLIKEGDVDGAVSHNLATLMRLGFFDGDPRKQPYGKLGPKHVCSAEHQHMALDAARQGMVLLKNHATRGLPFSSKTIRSLAVIGPNANASKTMIGNYEGTPCEYVTPLQGLARAACVDSVVYQPGCQNVACGSAQIGAAKKAAEKADATVLIVGTDQSIEREGLDRVDLLLPGQQPALVKQVAKASKGPVVLVIMSGGPFDISFAKHDHRVSSILWVGFPGEKGGAALADVIFGKHNPSGRSPFTWYPQSFAAKVPMTDMSMRPNPATGYPGRTYRFYTGDVVYAFGDGLSYGHFNHRLLRAPTQISVPLEPTSACRAGSCGSVDPTESRCGELAFDVHLRVQNAGAVSGSHTVLLFFTPPAVHGAPRKHLLGFERIHLGSGEAATVAFKVDVCKELSVVDEDGRRKLALGPHLLHVGSLKHAFTLNV